MPRWPGAKARVVPEGDALAISFGFIVPKRDAIATRWPEAFSRVVPEGDALAYDFRVRVGEVRLHS